MTDSVNIPLWKRFILGFSLFLIALSVMGKLQDWTSDHSKEINRISSKMHKMDDSITQKQLSENIEFMNELDEHYQKMKSNSLWEYFAIYFLVVIFAIILSQVVIFCYTQIDFFRSISVKTENVVLKIFIAIVILGGLLFIGTNSANAKQTSKVGINLISHFEGMELTAYQDVAGVWTIGAGTTKNVHPGMKITKEKAITFLKRDLNRFEKYLQKRVDRILTQYQHDALISFVYNIGSLHGNMYKSVVKNNTKLVVYWMNKYIYAGGKIWNGLIRRRKLESLIYKNNCETIIRFS